MKKIGNLLENTLMLITDKRKHNNCVYYKKPTGLKWLFDDFPICECPDKDSNICICQDCTTCPYYKTNNIENMDNEEAVELDFIQILNYHVGETFYSPIYGEIKLKSINASALNLTFTTQDDVHVNFMRTGKVSDYGECMLFPDKETRTWDDFIKNNNTINTWHNLINRNPIPELSAYIKPGVNGDLSGTKVDTITERSALALMKIIFLISYAYGGLVENKDLGDSSKTIYNIEYDVFTNKFIITNSCPMRFKNPLSFYNADDAARFLSFNDNVKLLKEYLMID